MDLLNTVKDGIEDSRGNWPQIAADSKVSYSWIVKLMAGDIPNPGILNIQRLAVTMGLKKLKKYDD